MVKFEILGQLGLITLDRARALNALSKDMILDMYATLLDWKNSDQVKVVVLRSVVTEVFCAGGDIRSVYALRDYPLEKKLLFFEIEYCLDYVLHTYPKPVVSLMNGLTMGGGVGIGMHVAYPIAGENMVFAMPETAIGLFPDVGGTAILNRLPLAWQHYLGVFAQRLSVEHLRYFNLIYGCIPCEFWERLLNDLVAHHWGDTPFEELERFLKIYMLSKQPLDLSLPFSHFSRLDTTNFTQLMSAVEAAEEDDWLVFKGQIEKLSPLSMMVTFRHLQHIQGCHLAQVLQQDFIVLQHFLASPELYEGIRAMMIDKDKQPCWCYPSWRDVPEAAVEHFFDDSQCRLLAL